LHNFGICVLFFWVQKGPAQGRKDDKIQVWKKNPGWEPDFVTAHRINYAGQVRNMLKRSCYNTMDPETPAAENGIWLTQQMCFINNVSTIKGESTQNTVFLSCSGKYY
jgi:hypothetical protein